jgi:hypothetical protein
LNEPAVQVNADLVREWMATLAQIERLQAYADDLKASLIKQIGDANAGMIGDRKVITHRPENRYATARLMKERGDLAQHFIREVTKEEFDLEAFKARHPDVADEYRVRSFRLVMGKDDE